MRPDRLSEPIWTDEPEGAGHAAQSPHQKKSPTILLFGHWGPAFLAFARSCRQLGVRAHFVDSTGTPTRWWRLSSCLDGGTSVSKDVVGTPQGIAALKGYVSRTGACGIIALSDSHLFWLAANREQFEPNCLVMVPELQCLNFLASKKKQIGLAKKAGFQLLNTWYMCNPGSFNQVPVSEFPIALRPDNASAVDPYFKVKLVHSQLALQHLLEGLQFRGGPVIAQPFRDSPNLVVHGVRSVEGDRLKFQAFLVSRKFEGVTLSMSRTKFPPDIELACRTFVELVGLSGCFHFELLLCDQDHKIYFLEINTRMGGTTDKAVRLGFDEPSLTLAAYGIIGDVPLADRTVRGVVANKKALAKHILAAARGNLSALDHPGGSRIRAIARSAVEIFCAHDSIFSPRDWRGFARFYLRSLLG